jgi:hypothetical protein
MRVALAVIALAIGSVPNITHAEPAAQKCRRIAELVADALHGRVASQLELAIEIEVSENLPPNIPDVRLYCGSMGPTFVHLDFVWNRSKPPELFWDFVGEGGAAFAGESVATVTMAADHSCQLAKRNNGLRVGTGKIQVGCSLRKEDGGTAAAWQSSLEVRGWSQQVPIIGLMFSLLH